MRKELLVYVSTFEKGTDFSVTSVSIDRSFVTISSPSGKFTANRKELVEALIAITDFDAEFNIQEKTKETQTVEHFDVEYTEEV